MVRRRGHPSGTESSAKTVPRVIHGVMGKVDDEPCSVAAAQELQVEFGGSQRPLASLRENRRWCVDNLRKYGSYSY